MNPESASPRPDPVEEAIFHAAIDVNDAQARTAFLDRACGADAALRRRIDTLLAGAIRANRFLGEDPLDLESPQPAEPERSMASGQSAGDRIGHYKLLEKVGEGGMGVVYMAEQEYPVRRRVALKIIKLGMDTRQVVARFEAERQALAMMDHPHIARVLDAGATEAGRPYFVMELVQGVPITKFCDTNKLSTIERLTLFIPVCQAIQSAHQKGIIHRDIKPSNVLVTMHNGGPHPMVIDFGVAKAMDQKLTERTLFTHFATMIGTPAYMSPEQAEMSKQDVDTRSDIYSLGVLLYELLTGTTPFPEDRLRGAGYGGMQRIIAEEEPERPSTRLRKGSQAASAEPFTMGSSSLATDLDWIVMKCLEKDRNRRYESASGLAADVQRHLTHEPILARPPSRLYEFQKAVRRHRVAFVATTAVLLSLVGAVAVSGWMAVKAGRAEGKAREQARIASQQTALAQAESGNALAAKDFLIDNLIGVDCCGDAPDADALTYEATRALVQKVARRLEDKFTHQPATEAAIRMALSRGFVADRNFRAAAGESQRAFEIRQRLFGPENLETLEALSSLAYATYQSGARSDGLQLMTNALASVRKGTNATSKEAGQILSALGHLLDAEGRHAEAVARMSEGLAILEAALDRKSRSLKNARGQVANATELSGDARKAETLWRQNYEQCLADHGPTAPITLQQQFALGRLLVRQKRWQDGLPLLEKAAASFEAQIGATNSWTLSAQYWLVHAYAQKQDIDRAVALATRLYPKLALSLPFKPSINYCSGLADFFRDRALYEQARSVLELLRASFERNPPAYPEDFDRFVAATAATKGWGAAAELYHAHPGRFGRDATFQRNMASSLLYGNDREGYRQTVTNALARALTETNIDEQRRFVDIVGLGPSELSADEMAVCDVLVSQSRTNSIWHRPLAALLLRIGRFGEAIQRLDLAMAKKPSSDERSRLLMLRAICLSRSGDPEKARAAFDEAESLMQDRLLARLRTEEGFIDHDARTHLNFRREAQRLLGKRAD